VEKVLMAKSKSNDGYVAKRENDPTFYQLNAGSVDGLEELADQIKPSANASK
jgi:hypothetical protein